MMFCDNEWSCKNRCWRGDKCKTFNFYSWWTYRVTSLSRASQVDGWFRWNVVENVANIYLVFVKGRFICSKLKLKNSCFVQFLKHLRLNNKWVSEIFVIHQMMSWHIEKVLNWLAKDKKVCNILTIVDDVINPEPKVKQGVF